MKFFAKIAIPLFVALNCSMALALPPQAEADRQMLSAQSAAKEQRWDDAVAAYQAVEATGIKKRPAHFDYLYGNALARAGQYAKAKQLLESYISSAGTGAKYYQDALLALNAIDEGKKRLAEDEAMEAARQAQDAKIKAGWKDVVSKLIEMPPSGEDSCANLTLRIKSYSKSARNIKCDCYQAKSEHPAYRDDLEERCKVEWQGNIVLDGKSDYDGMDVSKHQPNASRSYVLRNTIR